MAIASTRFETTGGAKAPPKSGKTDQTKAQTRTEKVTERKVSAEAEKATSPNKPATTKMPPKAPKETTGWLDPRSYIHVTNDGSLQRFRGRFYLWNVEFKFSLVEQANGKYPLRGNISPISPIDGHILTLKGKARTQKLEQLGITPDEIDSGHRNQALNVTKQIYARNKEIDTVKTLVANAALCLYTVHAARIYRDQGEIASPDTISPIVAAIKYADDFLRVNHKALKEKSVESYRKQLLSCCSALPNYPMRSFKPKELEKILLSNKTSEFAKKLLFEFWAYCLDKKVTHGTNPVPPKERKKRQPTAKQDNLDRRTELDIDQQDDLFVALCDNHSGGDCGVALQVWGGITPVKACTITWGDLILDSTHRDFVRLRLYYDDHAGATHDYTFPVFPFGALVLWARYDELTAQYDTEALKKMPVVSMVSDPCVAMKPDALTQYSTAVLQKIGISNQLFNNLRKANTQIAASRQLLKNTYVKNVTTRCGLQNEPGTISYLLHEQLKNVTDDYYTTLSDEEGNNRLHTLMSAVQPYFEFEHRPQLVQVYEDMTTIQVTPEHTRQRVGFFGKILLAPGESITIRCPHGVTGTIRVRGLDSNGNLRRKQPRKSE